MHITDMEFALSRRYNADVAAVTAEASAIIRQCNATIVAQREELKTLRARLAVYEAEERAVALEAGTVMQARVRAIRARLDA